MPDFIVTHDGSSLYLVRPDNEAAREHLEENTADDAQWFGPALVVEHRYIAYLVMGLRSAGFTVSQ